VTATDTVHTKELTGIEKIAVAVGAVGGVLEIAAHVKMPSIFTNSWIPFPGFPNPDNWKIDWDPETFLLEIASAEVILRSGDGFINLKESNIKNVTEIHGNNFDHVAFPNGIDVGSLSITGDTDIVGGDLTMDGMLTVTGLEGIDVTKAVITSLHAEKITPFPGTELPWFNFYSFIGVDCGAKVTAARGEFSIECSTPLLKVNTLKSKATAMPLLFDGFSVINFGDLPMSGYPPVWDEVGGGAQFNIVDNAYVIPLDIDMGVYTLTANTVVGTLEVSAPTTSTQTIQMPTTGFINGDKSDPALSTELRFNDWD
jgi:hypothetical protein